jgi:hypothetical protein
MRPECNPSVTIFLSGSIARAAVAHARVRATRVVKLPLTLNA